MESMDAAQSLLKKVGSDFSQMINSIR